MLRTLSIALVATAALAAAPPGFAATLKLATIAPAGTTWMKEVLAGADLIKQRSNGRVKIKFYPGGVMGNDKSVLRKMRIGQLHGGMFTGGEIANIDPNVRVYNMPMQFRSLEEVQHVRQHMDAAIRASLEEHGLVAVGISNGGLVYMMSGLRAQSLEEMRSHRVWIPAGDPVTEVVFRLANLNAVPLPIADVYTGLQTGLIDTVTSTTTAAIAFQWHTKVRYMIDFPVSSVTGYLAIATKPFYKLSEPDQGLVREVMGEVFKRLDTLNRQDNVAALEALKGNGMEVLTLSGAERARWQDIAVRATSEMTEAGAFSPELLQQVTSYRDAYRSKASAVD